MNTRSTPEGILLDLKNENRMDSVRKATRQSIFQNNRTQMMENDLRSPSKPKKTPSKKSVKKTPLKKKTTSEQSIDQTSKCLLEITPTKQGLLVESFLSKLSIKNIEDRKEGEEKQQENEKQEDQQEKHQEQQEDQDMILPEIEDPNKTIDDFIGQQPEIKSKTLDFRKIEDSKIYILQSKNYNRLTSLAKGFLDKISREESIVETSTYAGDENMFVISIREPKQKSRKTLLSTVNKDYIYDKEYDVWGTLEFLYTKVVLTSFLLEKKKIAGRLND
jgi:hypothetical protein